MKQRIWLFRVYIEDATTQFCGDYFFEININEDAYQTTAVR